MAAWMDPLCPSNSPGKISVDEINGLFVYLRDNDVLQ
jgi:hypothetical protein